MNANVTNKYAKKWSGKKGDGTIFGLDEVQFNALGKFIHDMQNEGKVKGDTFTPRVLVDTALHIFGAIGYSLVGMYNFLVWATGEEEDKYMIMATIGHDLNGKHDRFFSPRTSSYEDMYKREARIQSILSMRKDEEEREAIGKEYLEDFLRCNGGDKDSGEQA
jgi:hypothetical protein